MAADTLSQPEMEKTKLLCDCRDCCDFISLMTGALNNKQWEDFRQQVRLASNYTSKCDTAVRELSHLFKQIHEQVSEQHNITNVPMEMQTIWKKMVTDLHHKIHDLWEIGRKEQVANKGKVISSKEEGTKVTVTTAVEKRYMKLWPHSDKWDLKLTGLASMDPAQCEKVGPVHICTNEEYCISTERRDGTSTYLGIWYTGKKGVAVKCCPRKNTEQVMKMEQERDLLFLAHETGEHIIRCYDYIPSETHVYLVMELPRHTLDEYVKDPTLSFEPSRIICEFMKGLRWLHNQGILHRNLSPETVVIDTNLRVRLTGIGSSHKLKEGQECVFSNEGMPGWRAKETLSQAHPSGSKASDIQVAGMLAHFVLTGGQHPFGNLLKQPLSTVEENIRCGKYKLRVDKRDPVARDLLHWMLEDDLHKRPNCDQVLNHPFMWDADRRLEFLECAGNVCGGANNHARVHAWEEVNKRCLQKYCVALQDWRKKVNPELLKHMRKYRDYDESIANLLKFIRNFRQHFLDFPEDLQKEVNDKDFLSIISYPCSLLLHTYQCLEKTDWTKKMPLQKFYTS